MLVVPREATPIPCVLFQPDAEITDLTIAFGCTDDESGLRPAAVVIA